VGRAGGEQQDARTGTPEAARFDLVPETGVGTVETEFFTFGSARDPLRLRSGETLAVPPHCWRRST
jgi:hypothetical protein